MNDLNSRTARLADMQAVLYVTKAHPDLPLPFTGPDRAAFYFTVNTAPRDAREAVEEAKHVFAAELGVTFSRRNAQHGNGLRAIFWAQLDSGLLIELVVRAEDVEDLDERELAQAALA